MSAATQIRPYIKLQGLSDLKEIANSLKNYFDCVHTNNKKNDQDICPNDKNIHQQRVNILIHIRWHWFFGNLQYYSNTEVKKYHKQWRQL